MTVCVTQSARAPVAFNLQSLPPIQHRRPRRVRSFNFSFFWRVVSSFPARHTAIRFFSSVEAIELRETQFAVAKTRSAELQTLGGGWHRWMTDGEAARSTHRPVLENQSVKTDFKGSLRVVALRALKLQSANALWLRARLF